MKRFASLTLFITSQLLFAVSLFSAELKIAFETWEPYAYTDGGQIKGITVDILSKALKNLKQEFKFVEFNQSQRSGAELKEGRLDGILFATLEDNSGTVFLKNITEYWVLAAIVNKNSSIDKFSSLAQFKAKSFGAVTGYIFPDNIEVDKKNWKVDYVAEAILNLRKLSKNRVDFIIDDPVWASTIAAREKLDIKILEPTVSYSATYGNFHSKHKEFATKLDIELEKLIKDGELEILYKKYSGISFSEFKNKNGIK